VLHKNETGRGNQTEGERPSAAGKEGQNYIPGDPETGHIYCPAHRYDGRPN